MNKTSISYSEVVPKIFIGDCTAAKNAEFISANNITLIVCASNDSNDINNSIQTIFIKDLPDVDFVDSGNIPARSMAKIFSTRQRLCKVASMVNDKYKEIIAQRSNESILIHCKAGVNRSALVIGLFMRRHLGMQPDDIIKTLSDANEKRNKLMPVLMNQTFRIILMFE